MAARDPHREFRYSKNVTRKFDQHRRFFVTRLRCTDFLANMRDVDGFDKDTRAKIRQKAEVSTQAEANEMFLETLRNSNGQGKWLRFVEVLDKLGYHLLREILTGEPDIAEIELTEGFLEFFTPKIKDKIDPIRLLPYLVRDGYIDHLDKQAIECRRESKGEIAGAELLLNCVQRLKKDVCSGLRTAFRENNMDGVIEEMGRCYEEFLERNEGDGVSALSASLSRLGLGGSFRRRSSLGSGSLSEEEVVSSPPVRCRSPTLCEPKTLTLREYQRELYSTMPRDKNTLILCPVKSGKRFVALKAIKEHLSLARNPDGKVAYLVTKSKMTAKVWRRCQVYLNDVPSTQMGTPSDRLVNVLQENSVVIAKAKHFESALSEDAVKWMDFSMVILELGVDYYEQRKHVYKQIMKSYHQFRRSLQRDQRLPKILVLSTSVCGESPLEDLYCTAMETCATFDIHAISQVRNSLESLRQHIWMPFVERVTVPEKRELGFDRTIHELISRVEHTMKEVFQSVKMPGDQNHEHNRRADVTTPPAERTSVKYMAWLKTNRTSLGFGAKDKRCPFAGFFLTCLRLVTIYQSGLFINAECRRVDALRHMKKKVRQLKESIIEWKDHSLRTLFKDFYEKASHLNRICSLDEEDSTMMAVKNKLAHIYRDNGRYKVAVLMKYNQAILYMLFYLREKLPHIMSECVSTHHKGSTVETERLFKSRFDVLITTWPILAFHLGKEMRTWDYVIRMDCPGKDVITWTHQVLHGAQVRSQFAYPGTESESPVDLLLESTTEKVTLEIAQLQHDSSVLYQARLTDAQIASSERELWSRSTLSLRKLYDKLVGDFFCNGCGTFVCNRAYVRNLDDLWLGLDPGLIHRISTIRHPAPIVFSDGYARLGRFVCKECGQKWGIIAHVLGRPHLAFAKAGLDYLIEGHLQTNNPSWRSVDIEIEMFNYSRDLLRCLPSSFCVDGETVAELQKRLPEPVED